MKHLDGKGQAWRAKNIPHESKLEIPILTAPIAQKSMEQSPSWEANRYSASQEISRLFTEPEGSLPSSQEPVTGFYSETDKSNPTLQLLKV
jgi:hypothetical protein